MKIFGQEVNPFQLFLILILLLAASGSFNGDEDEKSPEHSHIYGPPLRFLKLLRFKRNAKILPLQAKS